LVAFFGSYRARWLLGRFARSIAPAGTDKSVERPPYFTTKNTKNHQGCTKGRTDDDTLQAVLQPGSREIHEEFQAYAAHAQVGQDLRLVGRDNGGHRLDFQNDGARDDDIAAQAQRKRHRTPAGRCRRRYPSGSGTPGIPRQRTTTAAQAPTKKSGRDDRFLPPRRRQVRTDSQPERQPPTESIPAPVYPPW